MAGLYIHVPFCVTKCSYCAFYSVPRTELVDAYIDRLATEYTARRHEIAEPFETVYLGGGTPSILDAGQFERLCRLFADEHPVEFTIEVNPDDVTVAKAHHWRRLGVNRVSMGVQSLDDELLKIVGRRHTADDALRAFEVLRNAGFDNISVDAIMGLPGQSLASWADTLKGLITLNPQHLSSYILEYEKGSRLYAALMAGKLQATNEDLVADMYAMLCELAAAAGMEHYEISNFASPGYHSRHNSAYWNDTPYLGLGPAAHSFDGKIRRYNPSSIKKWLDGEQAIVDVESEVDRLNDRLMTALRTARGFDYTSLTTPRLSEFKHAMRKVPADLVIDDGKTLRITEPGWLLADAITSALLFS